MHTPDLPLLGQNSYKLGLGLWNHWMWAVALELAVLLGGWALWMAWRGDRPRRRDIVFLIVLVALTLATPFMPVPGSAGAFGVQALVSYVVLAFLVQMTEAGSPQYIVSAAGHPMSQDRRRN
jgi:hypothetical protein